MEFNEFAAKHYLALSVDEIRHNVLLTILKRGQRDPDLQVRTWDLGQPGCCAVQQQGYGIVLGDVDHDHARSLANDVVEDEIPSVMGPDDTARWFAEASAHLGKAYPNVMAQTIHVLDQPPRRSACKGAARLATLDDLDLVLEWLVAFVDEAVPEDTPPTLEDARQRIENGRIYLWCVDNRPVAMSCVGRQLDIGIAIAPVFTPPAHRCHGYAGAVTAAIVEQALQRGYRCAYLFTDDSNPASSRCYAKIGFRPYCKSNVYRR